MPFRFRITNYLQKAVAVLIVLALLLTGIVLLFDRNLRALLNEYALSEASVRVNTLLNREVCNYLSQEPTSYSDLVNLVTDSNGNVQSVSIQSVTMNHLKAGIVSSLQNAISRQNEYQINIPLGTLIGSEFTLNRGPKFHTYMEMSSAVSSKLISSFESAGINQTKHQIMMHIQVEVYLVFPWYRQTETVTDDFILTETVIVGTVPNAYTVVNEAESDQISGIVNDYGAEIS